MAFVDLFGATSGAVQGDLDVTHRRFEPVELELLPRGLAWDREDPQLLAIVAAQMTELSRVDLRAKALEDELDPHKTFALIDDWEFELGLPECAKPVTLEARRAAVIAKLLAEGGHDQGHAWWVEVLTKLGYPPTFFLHASQGMTCIDDCNDVLSDEDAWKFIWAIFVQAGKDDALVKCFVEHNALLGSLAVVHVMWQLLVLAGPAHDIRGAAVTSKGFAATVGEDGYNFHAADQYDEVDGWSAGAQQGGNMHAVAAVGDILVACGAGINFLRSLNLGATWTSSGDATAEMFAVTKGVGDGVAVAGGDGGETWRSVDFGDSWTQVATIGETIHGLTRCSGAVLAVTAAGRVHRSTNNGTSWTATGSTDPATALYGAGGWQQTVVVVGAGGVILRSEDAGTSFEPVVSPTTADLRGVIGNAAGRWTACGDDGVILQSLDNGVTWAVQVTPTTKDLYAVTRHVPSGLAIIVGADNTIILE